MFVQPFLRMNMGITTRMFDSVVRVTLKERTLLMLYKSAAVMNVQTLTVELTGIEGSC